MFRERSVWYAPVFDGIYLEASGGYYLIFSVDKIGCIESRFQCVNLILSTAAPRRSFAYAFSLNQSITFKIMSGIWRRNIFREQRSHPLLFTPCSAYEDSGRQIQNPSVRRRKDIFPRRRRSVCICSDQPKLCRPPFWKPHRIPGSFQRRTFCSRGKERSQMRMLCSLDTDVVQARFHAAAGAAADAYLEFMRELDIPHFYIELVIYNFGDRLCRDSNTQVVPLQAVIGRTLSPVPPKWSPRCAAKLSASGILSKVFPISQLPDGR